MYLLDSVIVFRVSLLSHILWMNTYILLLMRNDGWGEKFHMMKFHKVLYQAFFYPKITRPSPRYLSIFLSLLLYYYPYYHIIVLASKF